MGKKRIEWLDDTKGFGICMIMLAHISQYFPPLSPLHKYICSFHVVIFFIVAGYLAGVKRDSAINIKRRSKELLIPYIVFSIVNSAVKIGVLVLQGGLTKEIIRNELKELLITGNGTVWFLLCLYLVEIIFRLLCKVGISDNITWVCSMLLMVAMYLWKTPENPFVIVVCRVAVGMGYYSIGFFLHKTNIKDLIPAVGGVVLLLTGVVIEVWIGCETNFFDGIYKHPFSSILSAVATCIGYMLVFMKLEKSGKLIGMRKFLNYFGRNSLIIMVIHPLVLQVVMYPLGGSLVSLQGIKAVMTGMVIFLLLVAAEIPFITIINRYFPIVLGRSRVSIDGKNYVQQNG